MFKGKFRMKLSIQNACNIIPSVYQAFREGGHNHLYTLEIVGETMFNTSLICTSMNIKMFFINIFEDMTDSAPFFKCLVHIVYVILSYKENFEN